MPEDKKPTDVELPDEVDREKSFRRYGGKAAAITLLVALVASVAMVAWFMMGREAQVRRVPQFEKAWIVSRLEGESVADDQPKTIRDGRGVMLYLIAYGVDRVTGEGSYYMESPADELPRVVIEGEEVPPERLRIFDMIDARSFVQWYKLEVSPHFYKDTARPMPERLYWTESRKHKMGNRWWAIADVRADLFTSYHYDYVGTMHYTADLLVFHARDPEGVYADLSTEGAEPALPGGLPPGAHRITIIPPNREGLDSTYRAYLNLFAYQEQESPAAAGEKTEAFTGGDSRSILIGALRLLGYDVDYADEGFLEKVATRLYANISVDQFSYFRPDGDERRVIPYRGEGRVRTGDIIVSGDRYAVLVSNEWGPAEPEMGALNTDDVILDAYNNLVLQTFARVLEDGEPMEIWRLNPLPASSARPAAAR